MTRVGGNYFSRRWRGQVPLATLLWRDMLGFGTLINLVATGLAVIAIMQDAPAWLAAALHFAPLPYNCFLCAALLRIPDGNLFASLIAALWLVAMTLA